MAIENDQTPQDSQSPGAANEDGFGAAFAERSAGQREEEAGTQQDGADAPSHDEPARQAGSDAAPANAATDNGTSGTNAPAFDPWDGLMPEQKSYFERLQASERSNRGRVGALTRKLNTIDTSRSAPTQAPARQGEGGEDQGGIQEIEASVSDLDKRLQAVTDDYGDVVGPIVDVLQEVRAKIDKIETAPAQQAEIDQDAQEIAEALTTLERAHPDYRQIAEDNNFAAWLGEQPTKVVELANSYDPREVSLALTLFKTERSAAESGAPGSASNATGDRRARQLAGSRQVPGQGQSAVTGVPNDFGSAFRARASKPR